MAWRGPLDATAQQVVSVRGLVVEDEAVRGVHDLAGLYLQIEESPEVLGQARAEARIARHLEIERTGAIAVGTRRPESELDAETRRIAVPPEGCHRDVHVGTLPITHRGARPALVAR